jgi:cell division protein FtsL
MAKNRKHNPAAIRFGPAVKAVLLCLLIGGSGVGYVWQKNQILELNHQYKAQEKRLKELQSQNQRLNQQRAQLSSQEALEKKIVEFKLGLSLPPSSRVLTLPEPAPAAAVENPAAVVKQLAGR